MADQVRIELGFDGGQSLSMLVSTESADENRGRLDALIGHHRAVLELRAEQPLVRPERLVEVLDRDAEMMDGARFHTRDASRVSPRRAARPA